jgi:hypothetical protein
MWQGGAVNQTRWKKTYPEGSKPKNGQRSAQEHDGGKRGHDARSSLVKRMKRRESQIYKTKAQFSLKLVWGSDSFSGMCGLGVLHNQPKNALCFFKIIVSSEVEATPNTSIQIHLNIPICKL